MTKCWILLVLVQYCSQRSGKGFIVFITSAKEHMLYWHLVTVWLKGWCHSEKIMVKQQKKSDRDCYQSVCIRGQLFLINHYICISLVIINIWSRSLPALFSWDCSQKQMFCGAAENSQMTVSVNDADTQTMHSSFKHKRNPSKNSILLWLRASEHI